MSTKLTENQVKDIMGINDWRNLSKDKLMKFVSILPEVDNEVAIKIIEQFPEFSKSSLLMIENLKEICNSILEKNTQSSTQSIEAYNKILDDLSFIIKKNNISESEIKYITEQMIKIADKISAKDTENKEFSGKVINTIGGIMLGVTLIDSSLLGIKYFDNKKS